jgi:hypothetical protein
LAILKGSVEKRFVGGWTCDGKTVTVCASSVDGTWVLAKAETVLGDEICGGETVQ